MEEVVERSEPLLPGPAEALGALLDVPVPDLEHGEGLPLLWHWVYLLDRPAQADLGPDGHPVRGTLPTPPGPGRRRMWAGGRVRANGSLRCGQTATRRTSVLSVEEKQGRSGSLTFVVMRHQILQAARIVIDEQQDIVYRDAVPPTPAPAAAVLPAVAATPTTTADRLSYGTRWPRSLPAQGFEAILRPQARRSQISRPSFSGRRS